MADAIKLWYAVTGDGELVTQLMTTGSRVHAAAVAVLQECGHEMADRIAAAAPSRSGQLRESIGPSGVMYAPGRSASAYSAEAPMLQVTVRPWGRRGDTKAGREYGNYAIALFNEKGTAAKPDQWVRGRVTGQRVLAPRPGKKRRTTIDVRTTGYYRNRPAIAARPFFAPAVEAMRGQFASRIDAALARALRDTGSKAA